MKGSPSGMTPNALHFYDFDVFDVFPLASQPHFDAFPVDFRFQLVRPVIFTQYLRRRQAVQDGVDVVARIGERDALQPTAIHELDALAELAFLETPVIRNVERLFFDIQGLDSVQAVNGRRNVPGTFINLGNLLVVDESDEIKIVLRKEQSQGLQPALNDFPVLQTAIRHVDVAVLLDGLAKMPHRIEETRPVPRFHIMESLIVDQLSHHGLIRRRYTAGNHLVQHCFHFRLDESPAVEQNLAQRQHFTVRQLLDLAAFHTIALVDMIINDVTRRPAAKGHAIMTKIPDILNVPLDTALIHTILLSSCRLLHSLARQKLRIQPQYP